MKKKIKSEPKKRELPERKFNLKFFIKSYPGTFIGIIIAIIIILLFISTLFSPTQNPLEKKIEANHLHQSNQMEMEYLLLAINQVKSDPEYEFDLDYYESMEHDFIWLKNKDKEIFEQNKSEPHIRQFASFIFFNILLQLSEETSLEFFELDEEKIIEDAKRINLNYNNFIFEEIEETFKDNDSEKIAFEKTIKELVKEFEEIKKEILYSDYSKERKYIEAKKLIFLSYY